MVDEITLDVIDGVKAGKLKTTGKSTANRYLGLVRGAQRAAGVEAIAGVAMLAPNIREYPLRACASPTSI